MENTASHLDLGKSTTNTQPQKTPTTANSDPTHIQNLAAEALRGIVVTERPAVNVEARRLALEEDDNRRRAEDRLRRWRYFIEARGLRYLECRLSNFECVMPKQTTAIAKLQAYADEISERVRAGEGIVIYGARGTGKDHLAVSIIREAIRADIVCQWSNGMDFFGHIRDGIGHKDFSEAGAISDLARYKLLYISDPLPPTGTLTEFQQTTLFRVLDERYSHIRPTIVTVNAANGKELDERLGGQNADRLRDGALAIHCDWPSHRKAKQ